MLATIWHYADQLGKGYGAYVALAALAGSLIAAARYFATAPRLGPLTFYSAVLACLLFVTYLPLFILWIRQRAPQPPVANHDLRIAEMDEEYLIGPKTWIITQWLRLTAVRPVDRYRFNFDLTGTARGTVQLLSTSTPASLLGPLPRYNHIHYEVVFSAPVAKHETVEVGLKFLISDPDESIQPYVSTRATGASKYGSLKQVYTFEPAAKPREVSLEVIHALTRQPIDPVRSLYPDAEGRYSYSLESMQFGRIYTVAWSRNNG